MLQDVEAHPNKVNWAVLVRNLLAELGFYEVLVQQGWETTMYLSHYLSKGLQTILSKTLMPDYKHTAELVFSICLDLSNFMNI